MANGNQDDLLIVPDMSSFAASRAGNSGGDGAGNSLEGRAAGKVSQARKLFFLARAARMLSGGAGGLRGAARVGVRGGLIGGAVLLGGAAAKAASGRSFQNIGANLAEFFFDDSDDSARANRKIREQFMADESAMRAVAASGVDNSGVARQFRMLRDYQLREEISRGEIERDKRFDHQSKWDIIIDRIGNGVLTVMEGAGKEAARALGQLVQWIGCKDSTR